MTRGYEHYRVGPESLGLTELEYETLRALNEGNSLEFFPAEWEEGLPMLLERELVAPTHGKRPTLNSVEDDVRGTQSHQGTAEELPARPAYFVTRQGATVLAQVGTFRREITTPVRGRFGPVRFALALGVVAGIIVALVLVFT